MVSISEANELALEALSSVAAERGFIQETTGWSIKCPRTALDTSYHLITPQEGDDFKLVSTDKILLPIAVRCKEIDDMLVKLFPNSSEKNILTCVTSNQLICKKIISKAKIDLKWNWLAMRQYLSEYFPLFLDNCEAAIRNLTKPNNLLKAFKKPTTIYYMQGLLLREIALNIHLGRMQDALDVCRIISLGSSEADLRSELLSTERHIKDMM